MSNRGNSILIDWRCWQQVENGILSEYGDAGSRECWEQGKPTSVSFDSFSSCSWSFRFLRFSSVYLLSHLISSHVCVPTFRYFSSLAWDTNQSIFWWMGPDHLILPRNKAPLESSPKMDPSILPPNKASLELSPREPNQSSAISLSFPRCLDPSRGSTFHPTPLRIARPLLSQIWWLTPPSPLYKMSCPVSNC